MTASITSGGEGLVAYLEAAVIPTLSRSGESVAHVRREPSSFESSYRAEVVTVELTSGDTLRLFLKDFGQSAFRKDGSSGRRDRERHVYRDLLPYMGLGTARYYGSMWDEAQGRFWLLLEFVDGDEVRFCPLAEWIAAAGWLGRLHGTERWSRQVEESPLLIRHDEAYFRLRSELALHDVALFGPQLTGRLQRVLDSYGRLVDTMAGQPVCFIHGAYRAANVLRARADNGEQRICPLDWELAAIGSPLHDLAAFVDGFEPPELDLLLDAYTREARAHGASSPADRELRHVIDCFRLHRVVNNLGRAERSGYAAADVAKLVGRAETLAEGLAAAPSRRPAVIPDRSGNLLPGAPMNAPELQACLQEVLAGGSTRLVGHERLKADVHRLRFEVDGTGRSLVVKWSDPAVARRCWLVARRWLPAVRLEELSAPLLAVAAARNGEGTWHVYEDLPGRPLATDRFARAEVEAAIDAIARVHVAFAEHPLLPECRVWGGDRGIHFYSASLRDAMIALRSLDPGRGGREAIAVPDALLDRIARLQEQEPARAHTLAAAGGPETLLHGDLWPTNAIVLGGGDGARVRLVDWDEAAVGPIGFDLSTFLLRFDSSHRPWILDTYRRAVDRLAGWDLPSDRDLNPILETAAQARLVSLLVWSVAAAGDGDPGWLPERLEALVDWLDGVEPVLPAR